MVGTGISGLAAAWLLSRRHDVTVFEKAHRIGGHSNTVEARVTGGEAVPVDTGFIVYNPLNYPNLTALFAHLGVDTRPSEMSFAVSRHGGGLEYAGTSLRALFAQPANLLRPRFIAMLADLVRFYRSAPRDPGLSDATSLGDYLDRNGYGAAFRDDHLLPMAAAIWSASAASMRDCSALAFIRFFENHGLLMLSGRPEWRTVVGGSRAYVAKLTAGFADAIRRNTCVTSISRSIGGVDVTEAGGETHRFDHAVIATHSDEALALLTDPTRDEQRLLGSIRYRENRAVLHCDARLMPRRRSVWSSWNYVEAENYPGSGAHVTYWMNRLQGLSSPTPLFVTLDPQHEPEHTLHCESYAHPVFDVAAFAAQRELWSLQGHRNTWFCGAYFGAGFHEDGLQAGLAVAEDLGGISRPWTVTGHSDRIFRTATAHSLRQEAA